MLLGDVIKKYRTEHKLSQQRFADRAKVSKGYISMLENNNNPTSNKPIVPLIDTIKKLAIAMDMSSDELMTLLDGGQEIILTDVSKTTPDPKWQPEITTKDEQDIANQLEGMLNAMSGNSFAAYGNSPVDELDEDDYELLRASLESTLRTAKLLAKKRYTPNKYKVTDKKDDVDGR